MPATFILFIIGTFLLSLVIALVVMVATGSYLYTKHLLDTSNDLISTRGLYKSLDSSETNHVLECFPVNRTAYGSTYFVSLNGFYINFNEDKSESLIITKYPKMISSLKLNHLVAYLSINTGYKFIAINSLTREEINIDRLY